MAKNTAIDRNDNVLLLEGRVICNFLKMDGNILRSELGLDNCSSDDSIRQQLNTLIGLLENESFPRHENILEGYSNSLAVLYEKLKCREIKSWNNLTRKRKRFFDWDVNLREVFRHAVEKYILPDYSCSLENIPIQSRLKEKLREYRVDLAGRGNVRELFTAGFPEMEYSAHWHAARWHTGRRKIPEEQKEKYIQFLCDYVLRHKLGCKTKEGVIRVLNANNGRLRKAIEEEKTLNKVFSVSNNPFWLVKNLKSAMYDIKPWELTIQMPGTFSDNKCNVNYDIIVDYLGWVERNYGPIPQENLASRTLKEKIPHYSNLFTYVNVEKLNELFGRAKRKILLDA